MPTQFPVPQPDETLERYTIRCASTVNGMDPDDFNEAVWQTWRQTRGLTEEEEIARRKFSPEKYRVEPGVCVFAEHKTTTADGKKRHYKLRDLVNIVRGCNERISDVAAFPAISDGHTANPDDPNPREPRILGYAGNYRLGRIGRKNPRWAIFQDEYHLKDAADVLVNKPRRSVELWSFADGRAHFDPVAAIGSEAPRLPLPQRFSTLNYEGASVERYTFQSGGWASPGANSTHVPTGPRTKKATYSAATDGETSVPQGDEPMDLSEEALQRIVAAIAELPVLKWAQERMEEEQRVGAPGTEDDLGVDLGEDEGETEDFSDLDDLAGPDEPAETPGVADLDEPEDMPPDEDTEPELEPEGKNTMYQAKKDPKAKVAKPDTGSVEKYAALQTSHNNLMKDFAKATARVEQLERRNADLDRKSRLNTLASQFPGMVDVDEEAKVSLYSLGGSMSDEQFDAHIATVEKYAKRAAQASAYIPTGEAPMREATTPEKYAQAEAVKKLALKIHSEALGRGKTLTYDECRAQAMERLSK